MYTTACHQFSHTGYIVVADDGIQCWVNILCKLEFWLFRSLFVRGTILYSKCKSYLLVWLDSLARQERKELPCLVASRALLNAPT